MNSTMWTYFFMVIGILGIVMINLFSDMMMTNEQNYLLLKETTEAAMYDAIDWEGYSRGLGRDKVTRYTDPSSMHCGVEKGQYRINKDKFVESFVRRFAEQASLSKSYKITFNDIDECPPKVSITITAQETYPFIEFFKVQYQTSGDDIVNSISAILEDKPVLDENPLT